MLINNVKINFSMNDVNDVNDVNESSTTIYDSPLFIIIKNNQFIIVYFFFGMTK